MKQILTILEPMQRPETFDLKVNSALQEGWELKKRMPMNIGVEAEDAHLTVLWLYAELEKEA